MINQMGQWIPDYPGQQPTQDPAYLRMMQAQQAQLQAQLQAQMQAQQAPVMQAPAAPQRQQPVAQNGFVPVRSRQEARDWYVGPGQSMTFIDENAPYCYTKSMGYSQLDRPQFTAYRLVKEEEAPQQATPPVPPATPAQPQNEPAPYALKADVETLAGIIGGLQAKIEKITADLYSNDGEKEEK